MVFGRKRRETTGGLLEHGSKPVGGVRVQDEGAKGAAGYELVHATIYAIRVEAEGEGGVLTSFGLDVATSSGLLRVGVEQTLSPDSWRAHLGSRALVRNYGPNVTIDWPATLDEAGIANHGLILRSKSLSTPLSPGIHDRGVRWLLRKGSPAEAEIVAIRKTPWAPPQDVQVELRLEDGPVPRTALVAHPVPFYAQALAVVGARVPVVVRRNHVGVDWVTFAEAAAGMQRSSGSAGRAPEA